MIRDEDVLKSGTSQYMKPHEKVIYMLAVVFGVMLVITGIVMIVVGDGLLVWGIVLLVGGVFEIIGVGLLLWTEGVKKNKNSYKKETNYN